MCRGKRLNSGECLYPAGIVLIKEVLKQEFKSLDKDIKRYGNSRSHQAATFR